MPRTATIAPEPLVGDAIDLRRKLSRTLTNHLVSKAAILPRTERALVEAVFRDGLPLTQVAALLAPDLPTDRPPDHLHRSLRRQVRPITSRLTCPQFDFVAKHRDAWHPTRRRIASAWAIEGRSLREIADTLGLSIHLVRGHVLAVEALLHNAPQAEAA